MKDKVDFDDYSDNYDETLESDLRITGQGREYYARKRVLWVKNRLLQRGFMPREVLDYGCGDGSTTQIFLDELGVDSVFGTDVSVKSIQHARAKFAGANVIFFLVDSEPPRQDFEMAYCNGVFHHIPIEERFAALKYVFNILRPGGYFAFWENNPLNPGTRYLMWKTPFDRDAVPLYPVESRQLLESAGFKIEFTDYLFFFPRFLPFIVRLEPMLHRIPLGGQYLHLAHKPVSSQTQNGPFPAVRHMAN
jgi:SAM-dependent methyltransferase